MGEPNLKRDDESGSDEFFRQERRERWAAILATGLTVAHCLAGMFVVGWFYYIVPQYKLHYDNVGLPISNAAITVIRCSDNLVNYWYMIALAGPIALCIDFKILKWIGVQTGLILGLVYGFCLTLIILANMVVAWSVLT